MSVDVQPRPAIPPFEPPPVPDMLTESGRRILVIVGMYAPSAACCFWGPRCLSTSAQSVFRAKCVRHRCRLVLHLWDPDLLVGAATDRHSAARFVARAPDRRHRVYRLADVRRRERRRTVLDPAFPAACRQRLVVALADGTFHAALASSVLIALDSWRLIDGLITPAQILYTGLVGFGYFTIVGGARAGPLHQGQRGSAAQRGIDVANLEQVNRPIIQDMQDGVLVVDLNGVVRGHNAQVTRPLGGFGRMRGGMRLAEFSSTLHDYGAAGRRISPSRCRCSRSRRRSAPARAAGAHRIGAQRRHADLPRGPGPRAKRGAEIKLAAMGRRSRASPTKAQSAVGDQPGGATAGRGRLGRTRGRAAADDDTDQRQAHRPHRR